jgi:teichuronic acid exporter
MTNEDTNQELHGKAKKGMKLLMGRQVILQILTFAGGVVLARVLGPSRFGIYAIATFLVSSLAMLGDFGLAASFIQRREELTDQDLRVAFTLQQVLTTCIVSIIFLAAPWLAHFYPKAPPETVWLVRALAAGLYLTSWRSMSALQLERGLRYDILAKVEVVEALSYQGLAVILALAGFGVWSLIWATLVRSLLGAFLLYVSAPWPVRFGYDRKVASGILRYGIPFQFQDLMNQAGNWVVPLLVGTTIGPQALGLLTWASSNGKKPLILVDNVMRVAFPHLSRLQQDRKELEVMVTKYLNWLLLPAGLWFAVLFVSSHMLVKWIYTDKWTAGVPALILYSVALCLDVISFILTVTLNSIGNPAKTARIVMLRSSVYIIFTIIFVKFFGFVGVPIAYILSFSLLMPLLFSLFGPGSFRKILVPSLWILVPILCATFCGEMFIRLKFSLRPEAICSVLVVVLTYVTITWLVAPQWMKQSSPVAKVEARLKTSNGYLKVVKVFGR